MNRRTGTLLAFLPTLAVVAGFLFCLPSRLFDAPYSTVLLDRDGQLLDASIAADGQWRFPADRELPAKFVQALVIREDRRQPRLLFAGTDFGVYATLDGGSAWTPIVGGASPGRVSVSSSCSRIVPNSSTPLMYSSLRPP